MATIVNLEIDQGTTQNIEIDWKDESTGLPIDLTGYTADMQVRSRIDSDVILLELSTATSDIVLGGATGVITLKFVPADTSAATWEQARYDLLLTDSFGVVTRVAKGFITLLPTVTR